MKWLPRSAQTDPKLLPLHSNTQKWCLGKLLRLQFTDSSGSRFAFGCKVNYRSRAASSFSVQLNEPSECKQIQRVSVVSSVHQKQSNASLSVAFAVLAEPMHPPRVISKVAPPPRVSLNKPFHGAESLARIVDQLQQHHSDAAEW